MKINGFKNKYSITLYINIKLNTYINNNIKLNIYQIIEYSYNRLAINNAEKNCSIFRAKKYWKRKVL